MQSRRTWMTRRHVVPSVLAALAVPVIAEAQTNQEQVGTLDEITVTARKVEENLQETPIAISAFTGDALEKRQVFSTDELTRLVPNLQFATNAPLAGNNSSSQVFIRGIGQTDPTSTVDPGVGLYIDDVYIGNAVGATMQLRDINNVQVLRGPQGTLFGRNTIGGTILLSSQDPGDEFGGTAKLGGGSDDLINAFLALDAPITDFLTSRFTAGVRKQDGYVIRTDGTDLGDTNTYTLTSKFIWSATDKFNVRWLADYTNADENGSPLVFSTLNTAATFPRVASTDAGCPGFNGNFNTLPAVPEIADPRCANNLQNQLGPFRNNGTKPLTSQLENWGTSLHFIYDMTDVLSLKFISAYRSTDWAGNRDADNTPLDILATAYDVESSQVSQELQATWQTDKLTGVAGLYYFKQKSNDIVTVDLNPPPPGLQRDSDNNKVDNESWAVFTQWTWHFNEQLAFTAGGRYTEDDKGSFPDQFNLATPNTKQVPVQWYRDTFSQFTPSASVAYNWTDSTMVYASYAEGFKGGGWNSHFNDPPLTLEQQAALQRFEQETAQTYELGFKTDLLGRTLRLNGAVFSSDYTDMQITYRGPAPNGVAPFITNAGKASIDGAELETTWAPNAAWTFDASVGYLDATIDRLDISPLAVIPPGLVAGNTLPFAPEWQAHAGLAYTGNTGSLELTPRVDLAYQSETFFDATNTREIAQLGGVTTINVSFLIAQPDRNWQLTLGVNNASDKVYPIAGNSSLTTGSGYAEIAYARPREYFALFNYDF